VGPARSTVSMSVPDGGRTGASALLIATNDVRSTVVVVVINPFSDFEIGASGEALGGSYGGVNSTRYYHHEARQHPESRRVSES
jgi:hypothetical protein